MNKEKYDKLDKRETELIGELTDIQWEVLWELREEMDFMKKCDKEGYVNKSDQWDKEEKEDFEK